MEKKKCIEIINDSIFNDGFIITKLGSKINDFQTCYNIINYHINILENDENITDDYNSNIIINSVNYSISYIIENYLNNKLVDFFKAWLTVIYNWNENILQNNDLKMNCKVGLRLLDQYISINESIEVLKKCCNNMKRYLNWSPPAFEVNKQIIERLNKEE